MNFEMKKDSFNVYLVKNICRRYQYTYICNSLFVYTVCCDRLVFLQHLKYVKSAKTIDFEKVLKTFTIRNEITICL